MKKLAVLRGIAIMAVVINHAAGYGVFGLVWWGNRFGDPIPAPNRSFIGGPTYYSLLVLSQLSLFSVPLFLFASGFFVTYAARGKWSNLTISLTIGWAKNLLWPFAIWLTASVGMYSLTSITHGFIAPSMLLEFIRSRAEDYYYTPLLIALLL